MKYSLTLSNYGEDVLWYNFTNFENVDTEGPTLEIRVTSILDMLVPNISKIELLKDRFGYKLSGNIDNKVFFDIWDILER